MSKGQLLSLVGAFYVRHKITKTALSDLLQLLNFIVPGCIVPTLYFFAKIFFDSNEVRFHFFCKSCNEYLGSKERTFVCDSCGNEITPQMCLKDKSFFLTSPLEQQLRFMLEETDLFEKAYEGKKTQPVVLVKL